MVKRRYLQVLLSGLLVAEWASTFGAGRARAEATLFDNLGTLHHEITTTSELAQKYFDQGLRLVYAFNHEEAITAFTEASRLDPDAPMPYWGVALSLGPNINSAMDAKAETRAADAIHKAAARLVMATPGNGPTWRHWRHATPAKSLRPERAGMRPMPRPCAGSRRSFPMMSMPPCCSLNR